MTFGQASASTQICIPAIPRYREIREIIEEKDPIRTWSRSHLNDTAIPAHARGLAHWRDVSPFSFPARDGAVMFDFLEQEQLPIKNGLV
ncbi:MAG: hypothetical protein IPI75_07220 [Gammaproteobacteria bacterium]|nr:hypothetical protein [Gammaproteobacteria bacterium]MBK6584577.1 hypothetical protein [Gammaproteobacteria bacterium]MBK7519918.1 hypothetical protein [Gammaproteobacteria bacterium]MBK9666794.1 hypothetical protein [Gammaproteobacteria bacterium]MBP6229561.1 hypothetical protein [Pseudomonadales bacterium]